MNKTARKHHYIPEFLLAGFTDTGTKDGLLWVIDKNDYRSWQTSPSGIAFQNDFYSIETDKLPKDFVERAFAFFEGMAAPIIKNIMESRSIPVGDDYEWLIMFLAEMAMRVPAVRNTIGNSVKNSLKMSSKITFSSPEFFAKVKENMKSSGQDIDDSMNYQNFIEYVNSDEYDFEIGQNWHIMTMMKNILLVGPMLADRNWMLIAPESKSRGFICSDRPLTLRNMIQIGPSFFGTGFAEDNTFVALPISNDLALFGTYERNIGDCANYDSMVSLINTCTCLNASKHLYFKTEDFNYLRKDFSIGNRETLFTDFNIPNDENLNSS